MLLLALLMLGIGISMFTLAVLAGAQALLYVGGAVFTLSFVVLLTGLTIVPPNHAHVIIFFGKYLGSIRECGFWFVAPFTGARRVSLQVRNFKTLQLKVNDAEGSPIEIAAVIVFRVADTEKALLEVENYAEFMEIQSKTAIRHVAAKYPYDLIGTEGVCLREDGEIVARELTADLQQRFAVAGLEVLDARLTHLAYATEIASAMLQRQQAKAILAAKQIIVEGAVGIAQLAIERIETETKSVLEHEQRISLINNLLVSVVSEKGAQPVINVDLGQIMQRQEKGTKGGKGAQPTANRPATADTESPGREENQPNGFF